jgi:hypothetical protein
MLPPGAKKKRAIDRLADAARPAVDSGNVSERSGWWWILLAPGKAILWLEYMFPGRITNVFGTARRRNVPLIQLLYSLYFYVAVLGLAIVLFLEAGAKKMRMDKFNG